MTHSYDITFCNRNCNNEKCERNFNFVDKTKLMLVKPYVSIASFDKCEEFEERGVKNE